MCNFKIGQKVVCIGIGANPYPGVPFSISVGDVLEINHVSTHFNHVFLGFVEADQDTIFNSDFFRPLITDYTEEELASVDISPLIEELELETV